VVSEAVKHSATQGALDIPISERDSQSPPKHSNEEGWFVVELGRFGRCGMHVHAGLFGSNQIEVLTL